VSTATAAVTVRGAGKRYTKYDDQPLLVNALTMRHRTRRSQLWALRGADFAVARGECVGVIGRNGSGKSTMLRMLAGVTAPSEGSVVVRGRIAPLVSVGVGFHPELTGRENVYLNGTILGMTRRQLDERFDAILEFSEIADFIDTPVKFYSSGMFVRLGFSVAIHSDPSVLLVDEVLAVGDFAFQIKCFDRLMQIRESGVTVVVVSHNLNAVRKMCDRAILLHNGEQRFDGDTAEAVGLFHTLLGEQNDLDADDPGVVRGHADITSATLHDESGRETGHCTRGDQLALRIEGRFHEDVEDPVFGITLARTDERVVYVDHSMSNPVGRVRAGETLTCEMRFPALLPTGSYKLRANITQPGGGTAWALSAPVHFYVSGRPLGGAADLGGRFHVVRRDDLAGG
jgi:ABC-2 type transport system ATP-binding protein